MLLTVLEFSDYAIIAAIVSIFAGGAARYALSTPADSARLQRLEAKLNLIIKDLGIDYKDPTTPDGLSEEVKALADAPRGKIEAIKLHRQQTGVGLKEAKEAVEAYLASRY